MERLGRFELGPSTSISSSSSSNSANNNNNIASSPPTHSNSSFDLLNGQALYHKQLYYAKEDNPRLHPRPPQSFLCECPSTLPDGDVLPRGIFYHIATNGEQERMFTHNLLNWLIYPYSVAKPRSYGKNHSYGVKCGTWCHYRHCKFTTNRLVDEGHTIVLVYY